jgi:NADH-quinone oxidoreductase subunit J
MSPILFYIFAAVMLVAGLGVVLFRNPVASALCLVVSFLGLAALFIGLDAAFIGTVQVLVYAGAVMVLFLFIIMLLDIKAEARRKWNIPAVLGGVVVSGAFAAQIVYVVQGFRQGAQPFPAQGTPALDDVQAVGRLLFTEYHLPFQVIGMLILVATIGVVVLSKRELK